MHDYRLIVSSAMNFSSATDALRHIGERMVQEGLCRDSYPAALLEREATYPTGFALDGHAVAIPHCDASHAIAPAIHLIRPEKPVAFQQADDDGSTNAELTIALVVTHSQEQLKLQRPLLGQLKPPDFSSSPLNAAEDEHW